MTNAATLLTDRAAGLRTAFDGAFAAPIRADAVVKHDFLAIRVGAEAYAVRLSEVSGLFADKNITRVPGSVDALLGIAGFRGAIVPVYSLCTLLGYSGAQAPRWLVIAAGAPIALAFEAFEGQPRVAPDAILPRQSHASSSSCAREFMRTHDIVRPILHLPSVLDAIAGTKTPQTTPKEE